LHHRETPVLSLSAPVAAALAGCTPTTQETPQGTVLAVAPLRPPG